MKSIIFILLLITGCGFATAQSIISYTFDKQGRIKTEIIQNSYEMLFNYDKEGNVVSKIINTKTNIDSPILSDDNNDYKIYPNPTNSDITIESLAENGKLDITVCDISGKILEKKDDQESITQFSFRKYVKGIYFLILKSENKIIMYKVVKI